MHVAHRLGKTENELYKGLDGPADIGLWLAFFGNPHLLPEKIEKPQTPNLAQRIRAQADMHNANVTAREARKHGSQSR